MNSHLTKAQKTKITLIFGIIILLIIFFLAYVFVMDSVYQNRFFPGIKIAGVNVSKLDFNSAKKIYTAKLNEFDRTGQNFYYQNQNVAIYPTTISAEDPALIKELIIFDLDSTLNKAFSIGRAENFYDNLWQKIKFIFINKNLTIDCQINSEEIIKILKANFSHLEKIKQNPDIQFDNQKIIITSERSGLIFDYEEVVQNLFNNFSKFKFEPIELQLILQNPDFNSSQAQFLIPEIEKTISQAPLQILATSTWGSKLNWQINKEDFKKWLTLKFNPEKQIPEISLNSDEIQNFLWNKKIHLEQTVQEPKFKIQNNKVVEFQASRSGREIDLEKTLENFQKDILENRNLQSSIVINIVQPQNNTASVNDLGIAELIGVGESDFSGSPVNRRHNIKVGAGSLNGLLIKPGEEFSTNKALGDITAAKGYLPELVIKGNETIPEYGGGLCQIATTAFRLAINSGLKITARKPHAYRVSYYEPAGTDATIYSPWPDFRFLNDTPNHLLLQTKIIGDQVHFELWGTDDGRKISTTTPAIWNFVSPGETKYIETTELPPEKVRCIESAHYGADAEFTRTITRPNGEIEEEKFFSHYRPWQAVCLVGVDPSKLATTTPENLVK